MKLKSWKNLRIGSFYDVHNADRGEKPLSWLGRCQKVDENRFTNERGERMREGVPQRWVYNVDESACMGFQDGDKV